MHLLDVVLALIGLLLHRLPRLLEIPKLTPTHVDLHASLLFVGNRLGQSSLDWGAGRRNLAHVSIAT
jgi:hypothetical protein